MKKLLAQIFILILGVFFLIYLLLAFYVGRYTNFESEELSGAIVVLGAKAYRGADFNPCLVERVKKGVHLFEQKYAPLIVLSGGDDPEDGNNEAEAMRAIAKNFGVNERYLLLEKKSASTYENLLFTRDMLDGRGISSIVIVSEPFHLARAHLIAQKLGIKHTLSPASTSECWNRWQFLSRFFLKEPLAIMWYKLTGKL